MDKDMFIFQSESRFSRKNIVVFTCTSDKLRNMKINGRYFNQYKVNHSNKKYLINCVKAFFIIDWFTDPPTLLLLCKLKKNKIENPCF